MRVPHFPQLLRKETSSGAVLPLVVPDFERARILNVGSARYAWENAVNIDIRPGQDAQVRADAHELPFGDGSFDVLVCTGTLQYLQRPRQALAEFRRVLRPGGTVYVDVPFMQPYCRGTPDLWRFSVDGLRQLFRGWDVLEVGTSIAAGPALADYAQQVCRGLPLHRVPKYAITWAASVLVWPLTLLRTHAPDVAGAFYLVARRDG